jgi:hypothetical protein
MSSVDEPFSAAVADWGHGFWQEAMHYAGGRQVALGRRILERYPYQELVPYDEPHVAAKGRLASFSSQTASGLKLIYLPAMVNEDALRGVRGGTIALETGRTYTAGFVDVRTGATRRIDSVVQDSDGRWKTPEPPTREDWVLVIGSSGVDIRI